MTARSVDPGCRGAGRRLGHDGLARAQRHPADARRRRDARARARGREDASATGRTAWRAHCARNRSGLIGLLSEEIATTPHAGRIILGAQDAAREHDLTLVIINTERESSDNSHKRRRADADRPAGRGGALRDDVPPPGLAAAEPAGRAGRADRLDRPGGHRARPSCRTRWAARSPPSRHLVEAGTGASAFLNNDDDVPATHERLIGYRQVLDAARHPDRREPDRAGAVGDPPGYALAREVLARPDRPTALFCYNDRMAMGAYRAAAELGLDIPDDLSIVGFDNQELIAANLFPGLTTVALPHYEMGVWAVETLVHLLRGEADFKVAGRRARPASTARSSSAARSPRPETAERHHRMLRLASSWVWDFWIADDGDRYHLFFLKASRALLDPDRRHWRATDRARDIDAISRHWTEHADAVIPDDSPPSTTSRPGPARSCVTTTACGACSTRPSAARRAGSSSASAPSSPTTSSPGAAKPDRVLEPDARWYETADNREWPDQAWRDPWVFRGSDGWHMLITARANHGSRRRPRGDRSRDIARPDELDRSAAAVRARRRVRARRGGAGRVVDGDPRRAVLLPRRASCRSARRAADPVGGVWAFARRLARRGRSRSAEPTGSPTSVSTSAGSCRIAPGQWQLLAFRNDDDDGGWIRRRACAAIDGHRSARLPWVDGRLTIR